LRLEILNCALDPLACFSFGTAMPCAGHGVRGVRDKVANWNAHAYQLSVPVRRKQCEHTEALGSRSCPEREYGSGESRLLLRAFQGNPHPFD
jgi:hypothetical protein